MIYPRVATGMLVHDPDLGVLLLQRGPDSVNGAGEYSVPGGKLDPMETLADGAARELLEETGVVAGQVENTGIISEDRDWGPDQCFVTHLFKAVRWTGPARIMEPHKHSDLVWIPPQVLVGIAGGHRHDLPLFGPTRRFIQAGGLIGL